MHTVPTWRPWCGDGAAIDTSWSAARDAEAWAVGLAELTVGPTPGRVLLQRGISAEHKRRWMGPAESAGTLAEELPRGLSGEIWCAATRDGVARNDGEPYLLLATWPAAHRPAAVWYAVFERSTAAWADAEADHLRQTLRRMQAVWDAPDEPGLGRRLRSPDGTLFHGDATSAPGTTPEELTTPPAWSAQFHDIIRQRWGDPTDRRSYDLALPADPPQSHGSADVPKPAALWVRARHRPAIDGLGGYDYLETRPLDPEDAPPIGRVDDPRVASALGYLTDHHARSPSLNEVAAHAQSSPFHFHRLFSRVVGASPKQFLLGVQLQMAKWRLRAGGAPVGEVAAAAGFSSHGHFTATFHRVVGESPTAYRERHNPRAHLQADG